MGWVTYRGHVRDGAVLLDDPTALPDGTPASVRPLKAKAVRRQTARGRQTLYERLAPVIGKAKQLPTDMAEHHDHYLYSVPKREARKRAPRFTS